MSALRAGDLAGRGAEGDLVHRVVEQAMQHCAVEPDGVELVADTAGQPVDDGADEARRTAHVAHDLAGHVGPHGSVTGELDAPREREPRAGQLGHAAGEAGDGVRHGEADVAAERQRLG